MGPVNKRPLGNTKGDSFFESRIFVPPNVFLLLWGQAVSYGGKTFIQTSTEIAIQSQRIMLQDGDKRTVIPLLPVAELIELVVRVRTRLFDVGLKEAVKLLDAALLCTMFTHPIDAVHMV